MFCFDLFHFCLLLRGLDASKACTLWRYATILSRPGETDVAEVRRFSVDGRMWRSLSPPKALPRKGEFIASTVLLPEVLWRFVPESSFRLPEWVRS